jgi:hypothetical protein
MNLMRAEILCMLISTIAWSPLAVAQKAPAAGTAVPIETFAGRVLVTALEGPWEVTWGRTTCSG